VRHVKFLPATLKLPFGGFAINLDNSKKMRKTGRRKEERLLGYGNGKAHCAVKHLKRHFELYNLEACPDDFLFAKLHKDGRRFPHKKTGKVTAMSLSQYNLGIIKLCRKANVERVTARGSRPGGRTDLGAAGVQDSVATTLGRWSTQQAGRPYSRLAERLLHHVVKTLGIKLPGGRDGAAAARRDAASDSEASDDDSPSARKKRRV
jgi:hypothetical protein